MSMVQVDIDAGKSIERINRILTDVRGGARAAAWGALKRAGGAAKTQAGRYATEEYALSKSTFMKHVTVNSKLDTFKGASGSREIASMSISFAGHVIPLLSFDVSVSKKTGMVSARAMRSGRKEKLLHAFLGRSGDGKRVVLYERTSPQRYPLKELYGPSAAHMLRNERVVEKMSGTIREEFEKRSEAEIWRILNGWGGRQ